MLEHELALYCAPALAGIKPSNLFSYAADDAAKVKNEISRLNSLLNGSDIYLKVLCEQKNRLLILVYRRSKLTAYLGRADIAAFLRSYGYGRGLDAKLKRLGERIAPGDFPHEIGAFLGYPIDDIYGFIYHKNEGCKYTGYWKVYKNVEEAKKTFRRYDSCRNAVVKRIDMGKSLTDLFMGGPRQASGAQCR